MNSMKQVETIPVQRRAGRRFLLRDVARVRRGTMPGRIRPLQHEASREPHREHRRARTWGDVAAARRAGDRRAGPPPKGVNVEIRGRCPDEEMLRVLSIGLAMAIVVIVLLLTANFQSVRLALVAVSTSPGRRLRRCHRSLAHQNDHQHSVVHGGDHGDRRRGRQRHLARDLRRATAARGIRTEATEAAVLGAKGRLRPILMTSCAMTAGMIPMALGWGEGGEQTAPLGRAVIGGLVAATFATLVVLPTVFTLIQSGAGRVSPARSIPPTRRCRITIPSCWCNCPTQPDPSTGKRNGSGLGHWVHRRTSPRPRHRHPKPGDKLMHQNVL